MATMKKTVADLGSPRSTKKALLIQMLSAKAGAAVGTISCKLGWQHHTTRAAITGLRKEGYEVVAEKETGKPARYRITSEPVPAAKATITAVQSADAG